jgi:hypothetical protein
MLTTRLAWGMLVGGLVMLMVKSEAPVEVRASELREVRSDAPVTSLNTSTSDRLKEGAGLVDVLPVVDLSRRVDLSYPIELPLSK